MDIDQVVSKFRSCEEPSNARLDLSKGTTGNRLESGYFSETVKRVFIRTCILSFQPLILHKLNAV